MSLPRGDQKADLLFAPNVPSILNPIGCSTSLPSSPYFAHNLCNATASTHIVGLRPCSEGPAHDFFFQEEVRRASYRSGPRQSQLQNTTRAEVMKTPIVHRKQWFRIPVSCETHRPYGRRAPVSHEKLAAFQYRSA